MNHLIISCSPLGEYAYTNQLEKLAEDIFISNGHSVTIRNLYDINFNPVIDKEDILGHSRAIYKPDVIIEQEHIKDADCITFIYPLYQLSMPALMKGYVDRVFVNNFAYSYNSDGSINKLLLGKKANYLLPMGATYQSAEKYRNIEAMNILIKNTIGFRGIETNAVWYFGPEQRKTERTELEKILNGEKMSLFEDNW
jgi:NAD(P)H dehydrogenase (quinone)